MGMLSASLFSLGYFLRFSYEYSLTHGLDQRIQQSRNAHSRRCMTGAFLFYKKVNARGCCKTLHDARYVLAAACALAALKALSVRSNKLEDSIIPMHMRVAKSVLRVLSFSGLETS